jgi:WD40 repeat protein
MTMVTPEDFIASYNHTLSSTFSHPTLPFVHHVQNWSDCPRAIHLPAHSKPNALSLSSDESLLAVAAGNDVLIYNTEGDMNLSYTLKGTGLVNHVHWVPGDGRILVSGTSGYGKRKDGVRFWDLNLEDSLAELPIDLDSSTAAVVTPSGALVLQPQAGEFAIPTSTDEDKAEEQGTDAALQEASKQATTAAAKVLVSQAGWTDDEVSATGLESLLLTAIREAQVEQSVLRGLSFPGSLAGFCSPPLSPDGSLLFYLPNRSTVAVLATSTRSEKFRLEGHTDAIMWVEASPDGKLLATSSWDSTVKIWDLHDGRLVRTLKGTQGQDWTGSWSPDGKFIAVGNGNSKAHVWEVSSGETVHVFGGRDMFKGWVRGISFERTDGRYLVASSQGGIVRVFDMHSGICTNLYQIDLDASSPFGERARGFTEITEINHAPSPVRRFGFKPTDGRLVVYDTDLNEMWEFVQDKEGSERIFGSGPFIFADGGKRVYSGDVDGTVRVWSLA